MRMNIGNEIDTNDGFNEFQRLCSFCEELKQSDRQKLYGARNQRVYVRRTVLDSEEGVGEHRNIFLIRRGYVSLMLATPEGERLRVYRMQTGEWNLCIPTPLLPNEFFIESVADPNTELWHFPPVVMEDIFRENPQMAYFLARDYGKLVEALLSLVGDVAFVPLRERLMRQLQIYAEEQSSNLISITHEMLANDLGSSREAVTRLLKQLSDSGELVLQRKKILLKNEIRK